MKNIYLQVRMTQEEKDKLQELATDRKTTKSAIVRKWVQDSWRRRFEIKGAKP